MSRYLVYDVFTDRPFGGNQLAVFPDASDLDPNRLQDIAAEFNFSEVTFVYPPTTASADARVRIFTPTMEIPFAGHPTIGTAIALSDLGRGDDLTLELGIGPIECRVREGQASFLTAVALERLAEPDADLVAAALGLPPEAIDTAEHPPVQVTIGLPFTIVALRSRADLSAIQTDIARFREGAVRYPTQMDFAIFAYVRDGDTCHARMFAPLDNIPEDPATGSACATLAALLYDLRGTPQELRVHQGDDMGRPSRIGLSVDAAGVTVSGAAVRVMAGEFLV